MRSLPRALAPTFRYWMEVDVHVFGFSIAANVLLSFFPFLLVIVSICRALGWKAAETALYFTLQDFFPDQIVDFLRRNLDPNVIGRQPFHVVPLLLLLFTANGVFEPLEVAFNKVWGVTRNRSFFKNQLVSLGLIFACGTLALLSITLTALNREFFGQTVGAGSMVTAWASGLFLKMAALPVSVLILFLVYWLLPNRTIAWKQVAPAAILMGLVLELYKYVSLLVWPWLRMKLQKEYGPFVYSVTIVLSSFVASMLVLAGAGWASRRPAIEAVESVTYNEGESLKLS